MVTVGLVLGAGISCQTGEQSEVQGFMIPASTLSGERGSQKPSLLPLCDMEPQCWLPKTEHHMVLRVCRHTAHCALVETLQGL